MVSLFHPRCAPHDKAYPKSLLFFSSTHIKIEIKKLTLFVIDVFDLDSARRIGGKLRNSA
jgi:hypothetical protein